MSISRNRGGPRLLWRTGLLTAAVVAFVAMVPMVMAGDIDNATCIDCHDDVGEQFSTTPHGVYLTSRPALAEYSCESCHGSGMQHVEDPSPENILNPANADQFGSSYLCLQCHKTDKFDDWEFSHHNAADVNCASCHSVHAPHGESMVKQSPELCYDCHGDVRAAASMPSHHPVGEGKMSCEDCHNPHGGSVSLVQDDSGRELCFSCHADKEGPFVYEHAPVSEDCMMCHTPHGSVADNLLKAQEPTLCLNCHAMHFHASVEGVTGDFSVPQAPERAGFSTPDGWKKGMLTKCTQCHTAIHGTDLPSQSISTGGNALTR